MSARVAGLDGPLRDAAYVVGGLGHDLARVHGNPVEAAAAEQLGDGEARGLAGDVPEGDVDRADHVQRRAATPVVVARVEQPLPQAVDLQRVLADQHLAQAAGDRMGRRHLDHRPREERSGVGLAHADDPLVGVDPNEEGVLRPVGAGRIDLRESQHDRLDVGDPHRR